MKIDCKWKMDIENIKTILDKISQDHPIIQKRFLKFWWSKNENIYLD